MILLVIFLGTGGERVMVDFGKPAGEPLRKEDKSDKRGAAEEVMRCCRLPGLP